MEALKKDFFTWNDYVKGNGRWEIIDGEAYDMAPAPYPKHQRLVLRVASQLMEHFECDGREIYIAPVDWRIDDMNVVQPDVAIFCEEPEKPYFTKTPPVVVEVLTKATAKKDVGEKFRLYERAGVHYYVIVEPNSEVADIFELEAGKYAWRKKLTGAAVTDSNGKGASPRSILRRCSTVTGKIEKVKLI